MSGRPSSRPKRTLKPPQNLMGYIVFDEDCTKNGIITSSASTGKIKKFANKNAECNNSSFNCKKCNYKSRSKKDLVNHFKEHVSKENNFLCDECGISLSSYQAFSEHMNIHKNVKPYKCEICGRASRQLSVHTRHLLVHEGSPAQLYKCSVCAKTFKQNEYLKQHMRKHIGDKPYKCNKCPKSFTARNELNRHKISHSSLRPFSCEYCSKSFKLKHNLRTHIKCHSGKHLWKCCLCEASFPQQSLMEKHKKSHTEVVQHVELVKSDQRTLSITSFPLDRRKVLHHQKLSLPPKLDLNDTENAFNSTVSLGLNNALIPMSVIASSFGSGDYIKMKIIDQINIDTKNGHSAILQHIGGVTNAVLVDEELPVTDSTGEDLTEEINPAYPEHMSTEDTNERSFQNQFSNHFDSFEKTFSSDSLTADAVFWVETMVHIMEECQFPLEKCISNKLHSVVAQLQTMLINNCSEERGLESISALHGPACDSSNLEEIQNNVIESGEESVSTCNNLDAKAPELMQKSLKTELNSKLEKGFEEKHSDFSHFNSRKLIKKMVACHRTLSDILQKHLEATVNILYRK